MAVDPLSDWALQVDALKTLIEACPTFANTPNSNVVMYAVDGEDYQRPCAIIAEQSGTQVGRGGFLAGGLLLDLERDVDPNNAGHTDAGVDFRNWAGAIAKEMRELSEGGNHLFIRDGGGFQIVQRPQRCTLQDTYDYFRCTFRLLVGLV